MSTDLLRHIPEGHRVPRLRVKPKSGEKTTTEALLAVKDQLLSVGPTLEVTMRRSVLSIDRQRHYRLRNRLEDLGAIFLDGRPMAWHAGRTLETVGVGDLYGPLKPSFGPSNTHPGKYQVDCPFCGLRTRKWPNRDDARSWYYDVHLKESAAHE